jgi:hypothetical protein
MCYFPCELRPRLEFIAVPRDEPAVMPLDVGQGAEAIDLGSKMKSGWSNGSGMRRRRIGAIFNPGRVQ